MSTRRIVLNLYKQLLRESKKIPSYNFRMYAVRKIRDAFRENRHLSDEEQITNLRKSADQNLELIRRQAVIGHLYQTEKLVIER